MRRATTPHKAERTAHQRDALPPRYVGAAVMCAHDSCSRTHARSEPLAWERSRGESTGTSGVGQVG